jgi:cysteinyl-tRNA synthetase
MSTTTTAIEVSQSEPKTSVSIRVYNTLTREKEPFQTVEPGKVGMYLCGPTVYGPAHIGHMVGPVIFDCVKRYLEYSGYDVTFVVNITDVDDKLINAAAKAGVAMSQVAQEMTADYLSNLSALGVDTIDKMPKCTDHMQDIIDFTSRLIEKGFAYESEGDVYFDVTQDADYGKLTNRSVDSAQGEGGEMSSRKRSPSDFALWKSSKPGEPSWESPWGKGRPGWHIECSAMSHAILGEEFDIHGGGLDLVFPHHENEMAQSESCHGKPMARYWMHNGLMRASSAAGKVGGKSDRESSNGEAEQATVDTKISRSKGGGGLAELIEKQTGERIRFFLLRTHYRSTIVFGDEGLAEAATALETFHRFFERYERITGSKFFDIAAATKRAAGEIEAGSSELLATVVERRNGFLNKMDDDFNSGAAISELFELVRTLNKYADSKNLEDAAARSQDDLEVLIQATKTLRELTTLLGLFREAPSTGGGANNELVDQLMQVLIGIRQAARKNKDFSTADRVRDELAKLNITLEDRKGETGWRREG